MANNNQYRSLGTFWFKEKHYQMFANDNNRVAFLMLDENGKYHYPTTQELVEIVLELKKKKDIKFILDDNNEPRKIKKFRFKPKIRKGLATVTLTAAILSSLLGACASSTKLQETKQDAGIEYEYDNSSYSNSNYENSVVNVEKDIDINTDVAKDTVQNNSELNDLLDGYYENYTDNTDEISVAFDDSNVLYEYSELLAAADDSYDYKWAKDYYEASDHTLVIARDSKSYEHVYGYGTPTQNEIISMIQNNNNITGKYKDILTGFTNDVYMQAPDADMSVFKHNLETLQIIECSDNKMAKISGDSKTNACYDVKNNIMYFHENIDFSKDNSKIEAYHELLHSVRNDRFEKDGTRYKVTFYDGEFGGTFTDEALVTNFAIQLAGLDTKSTYYTLQCNYYRVFQDVLGDNYSLSDYINHSINNLTTKMDEYMGDQPGYASGMIQQIDAQASFAYSSLIEPDAGNNQELYNYMIDLYCKAHLTEGMSAEEANQVFESFYNEIFFNYDNISKYYNDLSPSAFYPEFERNCQNLGISTSLSR